MKNVVLMLLRYFRHGIELAKAALANFKRIRELIFKVGVTDMLKNIFAAIEAIIRAAIYLLILLMGLAIAGLGAYTILFLALRIGQFLYQLILKDPWL
jgi:hypothetical protein